MLRQWWAVVVTTAEAWTSSQSRQTQKEGPSAEGPSFEFTVALY